jgi:hypothetical protein
MAGPREGSDQGDGGIGLTSQPTVGETMGPGL